MAPSDTAVVRLDLPADADYLHLVGALIAAFLEPADGPAVPPQLLDGIQLAAHEICANMVRHAYPGRSDGRIAVSLRLEAHPRRLLIELRDTGLPFDPAQVRAPAPDDLPAGGYGLLLVHKLMDEVRYTPGPDGNRWRLVKYLEL